VFNFDDVGSMDFITDVIFISDTSVISLDVKPLLDPFSIALITLINLTLT